MVLNLHDEGDQTYEVGTPHAIVIADLDTAVVIEGSNVQLIDALDLLILQAETARHALIKEYMEGNKA